MKKSIKNKYPINTFKGETQKELINFLKEEMEGMVPETKDGYKNALEFERQGGYNTAIQEIRQRIDKYFKE